MKKKTTDERLSAKKADKHLLYEASVQSTDMDISFIHRVHRKHHGVDPLTLREDFCGTAKLCADWVCHSAKHQAIGVDLHGPTLKWGQLHHLAAIGEAAQRVSLLQQNVLEPIPSRVDVAVAFNFSYCIFKERPMMLRYMKGVCRSLHKKGMFFMDIHGGPECFEEIEESTQHKNFTYVWDQKPYNPVNGHAVRNIHFRFKDGTALKNAFVYDWRLWTLPELRDLLIDAGFSSVDVYWEGSNAKGKGNGVFRKVSCPENDLSWVAYIVAHK